MTDQVKLTKFSHGSGCGCKIAPAVLESILSRHSSTGSFPGLIVGNETRDDAAVFDLNDNRYLISTVDFFTPIVDDPFDFGRVSAANAISDVYAMGGRPLLAVAILGFPVDKLPAEVAGEIIRGAGVICSEAGIPLAGGHSIDLQEPVFGLAVNGLVDKANLQRNNTARPGDLLFLTKPLGTGILSSAAKRGLIKQEELFELVSVMTRLNSIGVELSGINGVHAMTDITGFGLLGHLLEVCEGSNTSAELYMEHIQLIKGAAGYRDQFVFPDNTYRNWNSYEKRVGGVNGPEFITLCDPQTSGGLLVSVDPDARLEVESCLVKNGLQAFLQPVGTILKRSDEVVVRVINGNVPVHQ